VEKIRLASRPEHQEILRRAFNSLFYVDSADVFIDLATNRGTGAISDRQWAGLMRGDEAPKLRRI
jgi:tryptophanase